MTTSSPRTAPLARVAVATCAAMPDLDAEARLLTAALERRGVAVRPAVWDDDAEDWAAFDLVVVRTTWDYPPRRDAYVAWAEHVATVGRILNPAPLLRWNTDKRYLAELAGAGVPVVPSSFLAPGEGAEHGLLDVDHVVKPSVSAGSLDTLRFGADDTERSLAHVRAIHESGRTALVQPYLSEVDAHGETALLYLDGVFSHAIRKGPMLPPGGGRDSGGGLFLEEEISPRNPSGAEREAADAVLAALGRIGPGADEPPLYTRVDLLGSDDGPCLLELELTEPSLFLDHAEGAPDRLAAAIERRLG